MYRTFLSLALLFCFSGAALALEMADVPLADGFDPPVGKNGKNYYMARGVRPNGHLGEDWNGVGGGDTDLGDPIYAAADGIVTFAQDYRLGWGNVVIVRSAYLDGGDTKFVDSLYGHLLSFSVRPGQIVKRGQQIARMGNNRGMYDAHLHFEMRKNINVGMYRSSFPRDWSVYWSPRDFMAERRTCGGGGRIVAVPIGTYAGAPPPLVASTKVYTPTQSVSRADVTVSSGQISRRPVPSSPLRRVYASTSYSSSSRSSAMQNSTKKDLSISTPFTPVATTKSAPPKVATAVPSAPKRPAPTPPPKIKPRRTLFRSDAEQDTKTRN